MAVPRAKSAKTKLKKGDQVRVIAGKHKGLEGEVIAVRRDSNGRVLVEGVNVIKKALRPTQENPRGGFREQEAPIHVSNVQMLDPSSGEPSTHRREDRRGRPQGPRREE